MNTDDDNQGGHDRRHFLKCMTWAGTAMVWTVAGGIPRSRLIGSAEAATSTGFNFVQISDSHLGFDKAANPNTTATLQEALNDVTALPGTPAFMIHTGDISHLSKPAQFDTAQQLMGQTEADDLHGAGRARHPGGGRQVVLEPLRQGHAKATAGTASMPAGCTSSAWSTW